MNFRVLVLSLAVLLAFTGCKKKVEAPPPENITEAGAGEKQDTNIQSKEMNLGVQGSDSGTIPGLYTINFDYDKASLTEEGKTKAQKNVDWLKEHKDSGLQIEGHADRHGSIEYNLALAERRAKTVKAYMVNLGASGKRLSTISYGKEKLLDQAETEAADAKNRRANFVIQK